MSQSLNTYDIGASGIPVDSTLAGKNVNESYLAHKSFSRIVLSNTMATQLPNCPCGFVDIFNPLGNDIVYVGGLNGGGDTPYPDPNVPYLGRGEPIYPGTGKQFRVADLSLLQAIAARNNDSININAHLSQEDFTTPTNDPPPNPVNLRPLAVLSTNPVNAATLVPTNTVMNMVLSRNIDPTTVTLGTTVTVSPGVGGLTAYVDPQNPAQIDFDPHGSNLAFTTTYTVTVTTSVKDTLGTSLAAPSAFSFQTAAAPPPPDTDPPVVQSVTPGNSATGISINVQPVVYMGEAIQPAGVTTTNVKLIQNSNKAVVPGTVSVAVDNRTITIAPTSPLLYSNIYYADITNLQDPEGNTMTAFHSPGSAGTFTTVAATSTKRYTVAEGSVHTGSLDSSYYLKSGGNIACGEKADSSKSGQNMVGYIISSVVIAHINTHGSGTLTGSLTVQIRDSNANLKYAYVNSISLTSYTGSNTPAGPITITDTGNTYKMVNGDVLLVVWQSPGGTNNNLQISAAAGGNSGAPYGRMVFWNGGSGSGSYSTKTNDDLAATAYSSN